MRLLCHSKKITTPVLSGLKQSVTRTAYLTGSIACSYIYDIPDYYLQWHELLMVYMNISAYKDERFSTGN